MFHPARLLISRYRSELLLSAIVAAMLASPVVDHNPHFAGVVAVIQFLLLLAAATYLADRKIVRRIVLPVGLVWVVARLLEAFGDSSQEYTRLAPVAGFAFSCALLWALLSRFGSISNVTASIISEAIISYLVIAIAFSQLYWVLDHFIGNAFNHVIPLQERATFLYFSMITISGVGYGGILPINSYVRLVAAFESITGVFYLAVVVSRIVSSLRSQGTRHE